MDTLKEFQQKIKNRKFAIDHSWKADMNEGGTFFDQPVGEDKNVFLWNSLNENLAEADSCKTFTGYWPLYSHRKGIGKGIVFLKKAVRKLLKIFMGWYIFPHYQRMSYFNGKIINVVSLERNILAVLNQQTQKISEKINCQEKQIAYLILENEQLRKKLQRIENLPTDDEQFYQAFEEQFRGSEEMIRERLRVYIPVVQKHISDWKNGRFIDIGSGRGEWLDLLREHGAVDYVGVDLNARQNARCEARGHHVIRMDCIEYLSKQPDNSADLISGFQIIEHLCLSDVMELLKQSYRVLKPGGMILFETQNPRNLIVGADTFYIDPSHKRPLDPGMIKFIVEWCGYAEVSCIDANAYPNWAGVTVKPDTEEMANLVQQFNNLNYLIYGPQDYAVVGIKEINI